MDAVEGVTGLIMTGMTIFAIYQIFRIAASLEKIAEHIHKIQ